MYSVLLVNGTFSVFELIDQIELEHNSEISGTLDISGEQTVLLKGFDTIHIFIETTGLNELVAFCKTFLLI